MSEENSNKTTEEHFNIFKAECQRWVKEFGLLSYHVFYGHKECEGDNFAEITINHDGRVATINLNSDWRNTPVTEVQLKRTAFHEVCELLLGKLGYCAIARYTTPEEIEEATHFIIRTLENVVFEQDSRRMAEAYLEKWRGVEEMLSRREDVLRKHAFTLRGALGEK